MREGPSESAYRSRFQTAASCAGQEPDVVNVVGKGGAELRQVRVEETNVHEPSTRCRNVFKRCRNRDPHFCPANQGWQIPVYRPAGIRHRGGVTSIQALMRNVGTCRPDAKGEVQAGGPREDESTEAGHRGGATRSRVEGPVIGLDRRGCVVRLWNEANQQWEEPRE